MIEHEDYFGKIIEVGDRILRPYFSELNEETITKITPKSVYIYRPKTKWTKTDLRLSINKWWTTKNLIKLKNNSND